MKFETAHRHEHVFKIAGLLDPSTGWYRPWYLLLRLEEELQRAMRYGRDLSIVYLRVGQPEPSLRRELMDRLGQLAGDLRSTDLPGLIDRDEYIVILPETGLSIAHTVADRLVKDL